MTKNEPSFDRRVGANIKELRIAKGITQAALAQELADRGHPFAQQTVVKIEAGKRPLRLSEADAIALALDVDVDTLLEEEGPVIEHTHMLVTGIRNVANHWEALRKEAQELYLAKKDLEHTLAPLRESEEAASRMPRTLLNEAETMLQVDPATVIATAPAIADAEMGVRYAEFEAGVTSAQFRGNWEAGEEEERRQRERVDADMERVRDDLRRRGDYELAAHDEDFTIEAEQEADEHP